MSFEKPFTKDNLEFYLKELSREFKKRGHGTPAEIILVGGASVIVNYGFRAASYDIDAAYDSPSVMKEAINAVGDRHGLPNGWLNDDFKRTASYTHKIIQYSKYYKTFSGVLTVRTVRAEYLVAMKLASSRQYKKDLSDVAGIINEQKALGEPLSFEKIDRAVKELYGDWSHISDRSKELLDRILSCDDLDALFAEISQDEADAKQVLLDITEHTPEAVNVDNVSEVIAAALARKKQAPDQN